MSLKWPKYTAAMRDVKPTLLNELWKTEFELESK